MQLSQKRKITSEFFFVAFCLVRFNLQHFQKKEYPQSSCIFELTGSEKRSYINV